MADATTEMILAVRAEVDKAIKGLSDLEKKVGDLGEKNKKTSDSFKKGFKDFLPDLSKANIALAGATAAAALLGKSLELAFKKQTALAEFSAITGVAGDKLTEFGDAADELSVKFGGSAVENIESFKGVLSRLGPGFAQSKEAVALMGENINTLAKASGLEAPQAMDALTTAMLQFGVSLDDPMQAAGVAKDMMNVMAAGAKEGAAEIPQIAEALTQVGVTAKGLGQSFESTNAAIQTLATGGKYGSEAGIALRNVMASLTSVSGPAQKALSSYNVSADELAKVMTEQGLNEAMKMLGSALDTTGSKAQDAALLTALFGKENMAAAQVLIKNTSLTDEFTDKLTGTNTAQEQAAVVMQTAAEQFKRLQASAEVLMEKLGTGLLPIANSLVETLVHIADATLDVVNALKNGDISGLAKGIFESYAGAAKIATFGMIDLTGATEDTTKSEADLVRQKMDLNREQQKQAENAKRLVREYEGLAAKGKLSNDQEARRQKILVELTKEYPGHITAGASYAQNLAEIQKLGGQAANDIGRLRNEMTNLSNQQREIVRKTLMNDIDVLKEKLVDLGYAWEDVNQSTAKLRAAKTEAEALEALNIAIQKNNNLKAKGQKASEIAKLNEIFQEMYAKRIAYINAYKEEAKTAEVIQPPQLPPDDTKKEKKKKEEDWARRKITIDLLHKEEEQAKETRDALIYLAESLGWNVTNAKDFDRQLSKIAVSPYGTIVDDMGMRIENLSEKWYESEEAAKTAGDAFNAIFSTMGAAVQGGSDALKEGLKSILVSILDFINAEFVAAGAAVAIRALISGGFSLFGDVAGYLAASAGLAAARSAVASFRTGIDYVPRDAMPAILHKGETVLTKDKADEYRKGNNSPASTVKIAFTRFETAIEGNHINRSRRYA